MRHAECETRVRLVYLLAASHSGSTLLAMLLGSHPDVCTVGELKLTSLGNVNRYRCSCQALIRECPFWAGIADDMRRRGHSFRIDDPGTNFAAVESRYVSRLLRPLHRGPLAEHLRDAALSLSHRWRVHLEAVQRHNAALAECILGRTGKKVLVDSSKVGLRLKYLLRNPRLDVRVIRLVRDGRAVTLTYHDPSRFADASEPTLRGGGSGGDSEGGRLSITDAAMEWRRSNEEAEAILSSLDPGRWVETRYETLCDDPEGTLKHLFCFIGVDPLHAPVNWHSTDSHVVGNGMRLDRSNEIRLDERWRSVLSQEDLGVFDSVAGETNRRLRYN